MIKRVISVIVFLLVMNGLGRVVIVYFHNEQLKDAVRDLAIFAGQPPAKSEEILRAKVMQLAEENQVPLDGDFVEISKRGVVGIGDKVTIKYSYAVMISLFPGYQRRFDFEYTTP